MVIKIKPFFEPGFVLGIVVFHRSGGGRDVIALWLGLVV
jgi:hypothetical protein